MLDLGDESNFGFLTWGERHRIFLRQRKLKEPTTMATTTTTTIKHARAVHVPMSALMGRNCPVIMSCNASSHRVMSLGRTVTARSVTTSPTPPPSRGSESRHITSRHFPRSEHYALECNKKKKTLFFCEFSHNCQEQQD